MTVHHNCVMKNNLKNKSNNQVRVRILFFNLSKPVTHNDFSLRKDIIVKIQVGPRPLYIKDAVRNLVSQKVVDIWAQQPTQLTPLPSVLLNLGLILAQSEPLCFPFTGGPGSTQGPQWFSTGGPGPTQGPQGAARGPWDDRTLFKTIEIHKHLCALISFFKWD